MNCGGVLHLPGVLQCMDFQSLIALPLLSKSFRKEWDHKKAENGYWNAMCSSVSAEYGLYCPKTFESATVLFTELWNARHKWNSSLSGPATEHDEQIFKINVACRFRPGQRSDAKLALPLHQFLKLKRKQSTDTSSVVVGEECPEEYLDPMLGTLMKDPVLLPTSNTVMDRSVALLCILRGGRDPFNDMKITADDLIPQPDLLVRIQQWKTSSSAVDISMKAEQMQGLVDEGYVDPQLLDAVLEAEQIQFAMRRAVADASSATSGHHQYQSILASEPVPLDEPQFHEEEEHHNHVMTVSNVNTPYLSAEAGLKSPAQKYSSDNETSTRRWLKLVEAPRIVDINAAKACVTMHVGGAGVKPFNFNHVFDASATQIAVYNNMSRNLVHSALNGTNACIMCYGQTGSGKTHAMFGVNSFSSIPTDLLSRGKEATSHGIVIRSFVELLEAQAYFASRGIDLNITVQYVEIYNETVRDLTSNRTISVRKSDGEFVDAIESTISNISDVERVLSTGQANKHFSATAMNDNSSRSHTLLVIHLTQTKLASQEVLKSKLYLIDLAGSERIKKSKVTGGRAAEAITINYSLMVLGRVISNLLRSERHAPYYESKLTTALKSAFGGNCRTGVIITCRSDDTLHGDETLQSLRFGERCGMLSNSTRLTASSVESTLSALNEAIVAVKYQLESLEKRNKSELASYKTLKMRMLDLVHKRDAIAKCYSK